MLASLYTGTVSPKTIELAEGIAANVRDSFTEKIKLMDWLPEEGRAQVKVP